MGHMLSNVGTAYLPHVHNLNAWTGDFREHREFRLPEPDRSAYAAYLAENANQRILVVTRETERDHTCTADYAADCVCADNGRDSVTEVAIGATPMYVANLLGYYGITDTEMSWNAEHFYADTMADTDDGEPFERPDADEYYDAEGPVTARYSARLIGFTPVQVRAIRTALGIKER
ncbi:hypothetical protein F5X71_34675 [Nocardia brasiliensis]|uniref:Uncharacterized protein n=1 Tax=Nocardia brasiliensis TaxID=37326 RepID=A0A6G9Y0P3_NOCBR|nr:hypothetical protein [Nocardia brasiliensis]QIS06772.1 hypothetical protein F5X71_34675 [Nocardia brasiliensis]